MARKSLNDLIVAGFLKPGDELTCEPTKGRLYKATVEADGQSLVKLMVEKGIGIARVPVVRDELDEDFFGGLSTPRA